MSIHHHSGSWRVIAGASILGLLAASCGSGGGGDAGAAGADTTVVRDADHDTTDSTGTSDVPTTAGAAPATTAPASTEGPPAEQEAADDRDRSGETGGIGLLLADEPTRFFELDWQVTEVRRSPVRIEAPSSWESYLHEDGDEDPNLAEDWVFVDLDVTNPLASGGFGIPAQWLALVDAGGTGFKFDQSWESDTGREGSGLAADNNRTRSYTISFRVDADTSFDGGWVSIEQPGYVAAAFGGPLHVDEAARLPVSFENTTYVGPFSRDEATINVLDAYWSRELGLESDGTLVGSPDNNSRRPPVGHAWLIVHFDVVCTLTGINTGGCNVSSGGALAGETERARGSGVNGLVGYGNTQEFWAAYPVPVDAPSVIVQIGEPDNGINTDFVVADLAPLRSLATPQL